MDPVEVLKRLGGIASYQEMLGPTTRRQVRRALDAGTISRPRRDRYVLVDTEPARQAAAASGGVLSHLSAARWWGWKVKDEPARPTVTVARHAQRPSGDVEVRWSDLADAEVYRNVTRPVRTVLDCAKTLPFDEALAVADSALRRQDVEKHELEVAAAALPRTGRTRALRVVELADGRAANPFESVTRAIAIEVPGLDVVPQGHVPGVGWVDLLDEALGLVIECDSFEFHGTKQGLRRDVKRYTDLTRRGLVVVRFLWEEAMLDPARVREVLEDVVVQCRAVRSALGPVDLHSERWRGHNFGSWAHEHGDHAWPAAEAV